MDVLVVGSGGREHALVWKLRQSKKVGRIYCAPGNGGISETAECIDIASDDIDGLADFVCKNKIGLTVVGPEAPLVEGIVDKFEENNLKCFGPRKNAAIIEGSKVFSKWLMKKYKIPTAEYEEFCDPGKAKEYLNHVKYPVVIKADGLAGGKGVVIAGSFNEAEEAVRLMMEDRIFKSAGSRLIIEEFLEGPEVSILAFTDGKCIKPMESAKDHKRIFDNDCGPNTGGMGVISPNPFYTKETADRCMKEIFIPTMEAMNKEGRQFKGVLFFGLILTNEGPKVLEYNCRFGDPETQAVLPRLETGLLDILLSVCDEKLGSTDIYWSREEACCVVLASGGYPGVYEKGRLIEGIRALPEGIMAFHSGTRLTGGNIVTDGGRVLGITAMGRSAAAASDAVYSAIENVKFDGIYYRKDIGKRKDA